jgi:hypothetical protein
LEFATLGDPSGFAAEPLSLGGESLPVGKTSVARALVARRRTPRNLGIRDLGCNIGLSFWDHRRAIFVARRRVTPCWHNERGSHLSFPVARALVARGALPATLESVTLGATLGDPSGIAAEPFVSLDEESLPVGTTSVDLIYRF